MGNAALGPWIHTASACRLLSPARVGERVELRSVVTEVLERNGHSYDRYDALALAGDRPVAQVDHEAIWRLRDRQGTQRSSWSSSRSQISETVG